MKINKKIKIIIIGGLTLSAPFVAFAYNANSENTPNNFGKSFGKNIDMYQQNFKMSEDEKIELLDKTLNIQIEHANYLMENLDSQTDVNITRLKQIVSEFSELEASLDDLNADDELRTEFRDVFFEIQTDARGLSKEFRTLIQESFSTEQREQFREQFKNEKNQLREDSRIRFNQEFNPNFKDERMPNFTIEEIALIDEKIASLLENDSITIKVALDEIKIIVDNMSAEERDNLFRTIKENHLIERLEEVDTSVATSLENGDITIEEAEDYLRENFPKDMRNGKNMQKGNKNIFN